MAGKTAVQLQWNRPAGSWADHRLGIAMGVRRPLRPESSQRYCGLIFNNYMKHIQAFRDVLGLWKPPALSNEQ